jgi:large subunit ribosomal protein L34e
MPRNSRRSRTLRRIHVKLASRTKLVYAKRAPSKPHCGTCGAVLHGVARGRVYQIAKLSKTEKRPDRPYGGNLCSKCMRLKIKSVLK